ncbi:MAG TPA: hypothetical protein PKZ16_01520, partial [bacterium]|nr:hypothetical protein [bacterium]
MINLDHQLFNLIYSLKGNYPFLDTVAFFCAKYLIFVMGIIVIIWWLKLNWPKENFYHFFKDKQKWLILSHVSLSVLISFLISQLIGLLYFRPRPFISNFQV